MILSKPAFKLPTPSALPRIVACMQSEVLPHFRMLNEPARLGTVGHRFLANNILLNNRYKAAELEEEKHREWLLRIEVERLPAFHPELYAPEISFAYDVTTGKARELGRGLTREEAAAKAEPNEMVGTADVVGLGAGKVIIHDYKFGWGWVDPVAINWQVLTYALMAARAYGRDAATVGIIRVLNGVIWFDVVEVDFFALEQHEADLRKLILKRGEVIAAHQEGRLNDLPALTMGPHCTYCPALNACPAHVSLWQEWLAKLEQREGGKGSELIPLTVETLPAVWEAHLQMEKILKRSWATLEAFAEANPVDLGNGWRIGPVDDCETSTIVAEKAEPVFKEQFGEQIGAEIYREALKVKKSIPKEALKSAISELYIPTLPSKEQRGSKGKTYEELEKKLAAAKALDVNRPNPAPVRKHKIPKPPKAKELKAAAEESGAEGKEEVAA